MIATQENYKPYLLEMGILQQAWVVAINVPRARFLEIVLDALEIDHAPGYFDDIREQMLAVAAETPQFPLGEWIDKQRGCGCIVGEYLVAYEEVTRTDMANEIIHPEDFLRDLGVRGAMLQAFGIRIDGYVRNHLKSNAPMPEAWALTRDKSEELGHGYELDIVVVIIDEV